MRRGAARRRRNFGRLREISHGLSTRTAEAGVLIFSSGKPADLAPTCEMCFGSDPSDAAISADLIVARIKVDWYNERNERSDVRGARLEIYSRKEAQIAALAAPKRHNIYRMHRLSPIITG